MFRNRRETKRWLNALGIAKVVFDDEGYHTQYLEQIEDFIWRKRMYSPKVKEELIPRLYRLSQVKKTPMTMLINMIIEQYLENYRRGKKKQE